MTHATKRTVRAPLRSLLRHAPSPPFLHVAAHGELETPRMDTQETCGKSSTPRARRPCGAAVDVPGRSPIESTLKHGRLRREAGETRPRRQTPRRRAQGQSSRSVCCCEQSKTVQKTAQEDLSPHAPRSRSLPLSLPLPLSLSLSRREVVARPRAVPRASKQTSRAAWTREVPRARLCAARTPRRRRRCDPRTSATATAWQQSARCAASAASDRLRRGATAESGQGSSQTRAGRAWVRRVAARAVLLLKTRLRLLLQLSQPQPSRP